MLVAQEDTTAVLLGCWGMNVESGLWSPGSGKREDASKDPVACVTDGPVIEFDKMWYTYTQIYKNKRRKAIGSHQAVSIK